MEVFSEMSTLFWERFSSICKETGQSPTGIVRACGLSSGNPAAWKSGRVPNMAIINKLSAHFGVAPTYFIEGAEKEEQPPEYKGLSETAIEIAKLVDRLPPEARKILQVQAQALEQAFPGQGGGE